MTAPKTITIKSDGNILELKEIKKDGYVYQYSKSKTKKNQLLQLTEIELEKLIKNNQP